jgi:hypothetical protein
MATENNTPAYKRPELEAVEPDLTLIEDLLGGTRTMQEKSAEYIRQWKDEDNEVYRIRRQCESVYAGLERTLSASVGMLFAKAPQVEWNGSEKAMSPHLDNIDAAGTKGTVFFKRFAEKCIRDGLAVLLVDHTPAPEGVEIVTGHNEDEFNLRPTWAMYPRARVLNWRDTIVNNKRTLTSITLYETATVDDGEYGVREVERYRELRLILTPIGYVAVWRLKEYRGDDTGRDKPENYEVIASGAFKNRKGRFADFLPVSIGYAGRTDGVMCSSIPLLPVAFANLQHWRLSSVLQFNREVCGFEQAVVIGDLLGDPVTGDKGKLKIGPLALVALTEGSDFKWESPTGQGNEQIRQGIEEKEKHIAQLGMSFMQKDTRGAETAEAKRLDATAENSTLATAAQGIEDAVNMSLEHHAWFMGIEKKSAPVLTINRDYENAAMEAQVMAAYTALANAGFPKRPLVQALVDGLRLPPDTDVEELVMEWEAGQAAAEEQKALEAEARNDNQRAA